MIRWLDRQVHLLGPYVTLCLTDEAFTKALEHIDVRWGASWAPSNGARTHIFTHDDGSPIGIVCIRDWAGKAPVSVACVLVHEAVHVWQAHAEYIGEHNPAHEQEAYAIQWISEELMMEFVRQTQEVPRG